MKVKVLLKFRDKHSGELHEIGEVMTVSKERFAEILSVGTFVEEIKEEPKEAPKKRKTTKKEK